MAHPVSLISVSPDPPPGLPPPTCQPEVQSITHRPSGCPTLVRYRFVSFELISRFVPRIRACVADLPRDTASSSGRSQGRPSKLARPSNSHQGDPLDQGWPSPPSPTERRGATAGLGGADRPSRRRDADGGGGHSVHRRIHIVRCWDSHIRVYGSDCFGRLFQEPVTRIRPRHTSGDGRALTADERSFLVASTERLVAQLRACRTLDR